MATNSSEPTKVKREKELRKFRWFYARLRQKFEVNEIALMTGLKATNLSSYGSGEKNPGKQTLSTFYAKMKDAIEKLPNIQYIDDSTDSFGQLPKVEEAQLRYLHHPSEENLRMVFISDNAYLRETLGNVSRAHEKYITNNQTINTTFQTMADSTRELVANNTALTRELLARLSADGKQPKTGGSNK